MPVNGRRDRCGDGPCRWCDRGGRDCRFCGGTGWWRPEKPERDAAGALRWVRVEEPCRMCANTGREHNPLEGSVPA
ncbi:hypothetical protein [Actinomadura atramentaria]|uniref:hypothetical protein n=1 Tax=Actinomadura atramentaria TaxID=1990 RepID=UPI00038168B5